MRILALILATLVAALPARSEEVVAGLSQSRVALTANFTGSEILVFGAVHREAPVPVAAEPLHVIVTIEGPSTPVIVWRKARRAGIWVNTESVRASLAPSFYAVAATAPLDTVLNATEDLRHRISIPLAIRAIGAGPEITDRPNFINALIRIRESEGLYMLREGGVTLERDTLFRTSITLPTNLTEGTYVTRIFLTRGGDVLHHVETGIEVRKEGLERWLFLLAYEQPVLYGLLALAIALVSGWGASAAFRYIRS